MQKEDLKQIEQLLANQSKGIEETLDKRFSDFEKVVDDKFEDMALMVSNGFAEVGEKLNKIDSRLELVESRLTKVEDLNRNIYDRMVEVTDTTMNDLRLDMDKVKFLHLDEWKGLPPQREISETLALEGLVS